MIIFIKDHWTEMLEIALLLNVAAASLAALTPNKKDDSWVAKIQKGLDWLSLSTRKKAE